MSDTEPTDETVTEADDDTEATGPPGSARPETGDSERLSWRGS